MLEFYFFLILRSMILRSMIIMIVYIDNRNKLLLENTEMLSMTNLIN